MLTLADPKLPRTQEYIGGQWVDADGAATWPVTNPARGERLGTVPHMGAAERHTRISRFE